MGLAVTYLIALVQVLTLVAPAEQGAFVWPKTLSEWQLFETPMSALLPMPDVLPYEVNVPLYSDYAGKSRFIRLPEHTSMQYHPTGPFTMPDGTVLVKNFYYPVGSAERLIETRLLVKDNSTWHAMTYQWNDAQSEAYRTIAGSAVHLEFVDPSNHTRSIDYLIPNVNQCKNCHNRDNTMLPLGVKARQLSRHTGEAGVLQQWGENGILSGLPDSPKEIPEPMSETDHSMSLEQKARAYLDVNCGHCHAPWGSARTSGLYLNIESTDRHALGVMKPPVAAGRGSGGRTFNIVPGKPNQSILLFRMESADPGIRMPEINRQIPHAEGIELIKAWIKGMNS